ncbi:hypothetical protein LPB140_07215 [Sphingorhabdus lutea]|uniref:histidine kinase n=1 Tax=Sphingorhabdus lutea TaxID=1913578 RepID=A0A1L3JBV3_9SPHN|nr:HAMP domain-containing sensor histidine kinase [Sphingorhabdus lutea]APG62608.1 hypothetical protein LPB140_07215 [Sphingorhabdus lutea]
MGKKLIYSPPLELLLDANNKIIFASPEILGLQIDAGGKEHDIFMFYNFASLANLVRKLKINVNRILSIAVDNIIIEMNVDVSIEENLTGGDIVKFLVHSWLERENLWLADNGEFGHLNTGLMGALLVTDHQNRIVKIINGGGLEISADDIMGKDFGNLFQIIPAVRSNMQLDQIFSSHKKNENIALKYMQDNRNLTADFLPNFNEAKIFQGFHIKLRIAQEAKDILHVAGQFIDEEPVQIGATLAPALRMPLGRIIANAETIKSKIYGPIRENYAIYASDISHAAKHLLDLVEDLGDLEFIEKAGFKTAKDKIDLYDLAERVKGLLAVKASDHNKRINIISSNKAQPAIGEFRRVLQILVNLVNNAIRYTPDGGVIEILIQENESHAKICIIDEGAGIAAEDQSKIFNKFERLGRTGDGGSGLGLYISRKLARAMGGDLSVKNATGKGCEFTLILPRDI